MRKVKGLLFLFTLVVAFQSTIIPVSDNTMEVTCAAIDVAMQ